MIVIVGGNICFVLFKNVNKARVVIAQAQEQTVPKG